MLQLIVCIDVSIDVPRARYCRQGIAVVAWRSGKLGFNVV
jgi:hypothetical protein